MIKIDASEFGGEEKKISIALKNEFGRVIGNGMFEGTVEMIPSANTTK